MQPKCPHCGFSHVENDPRCENLRKLGAKLNAKLSLHAVPLCTKALHGSWTDGGWEDFMAMTEPMPNRVSEWRDEYYRYLSRNCIRCGSTLSKMIGSVAAQEAMRGGGR